MSQKELRRLDVMHRVERGQVTQKLAAALLKVSDRQVRRLMRRFEQGGAKALVHQNRGRVSTRRTDEKVREKIVSLRRGKYEGFNDRHFSEKLVSDEGIALSRDAVRCILRANGIGPTKKRRRSKHRSRRERKPSAGMMALWDGSRHDWLEGRGPWLCLMGAVDDATGEFLPGSRFYEHECAEGYLRILYETARHKGLMQSIYGDKHGALKRHDEHWTLEEELRGEQDPTQVGRALKELGITQIDAHSPQAKGRIERPWGTAQDRLVSELRLAKACTIEEANAVLERQQPIYNARFAKAPKDAESAWRKVPKSMDLERVCAFRYEATVGNDHAVRIGGLVLDIPKQKNGRTYAKARVELRQLLDGSWRIYHQNKLIVTLPPTDVGELRARPQRKRSAASKAFRKAVFAA